MRLTGNNTYTGNTTINGGTLQVTGAGGYLYNGGYNSTAVIQVNATGTLLLDSFAYGAAGARASCPTTGHAGSSTAVRSGHRQHALVRQQLHRHRPGRPVRIHAAGQTLTLSGNGNGNLQLDGPLALGGAGTSRQRTVRRQPVAPQVRRRHGDAVGRNTYTGTTTVDEARCW